MVLFNKRDYECATERDLEELFKEAAKRGAVLATMHFDAHGRTPEYAKNFLVDFISRLSKEPGVLYCKGEIESEIENEGIYSTCSEVRILVECLSVLFDVCMRYGPLAVEIVEPSEFKIDVQEMQNLLLDVSKMSMDYSRYILEKTLKPEEAAFLREKMTRRAEFGKRLAEKGIATTESKRSAEQNK
ncbi:MAG: hypothetical protein QW343_03855 [Candidatus Norongarragalinales archaeon]